MGGASLIREDTRNDVTAEATKWVYSTENISDELKTDPITGLLRDVGGQLIDGKEKCLSIDKFENYVNADNVVETRLQYGTCLVAITEDLFKSDDFTQLWTAELSESSLEKAYIRNIGTDLALIRIKDFDT